jgi:hypothetical protein
MGDGRIFLKIRRASSFNKDLSNEPNFGRIHLAGQVPLKVHKNENFFGSDFKICIFSKIVRHKY